MPGPSRRTILHLAAAATPLLARALPAEAQAGFPNRAVTIVLPVAAGGPGDMLGRLLAQEMSADLGQPVVIENRTGAGGSIGLDYVARSRPDGHTLAIVSNSTYSIAPHLYRLPYNNDTAFTAIAMLAGAPSFLCVHRDVPATTVAELLALARQRPNELTFGTAGIGFTSHLATELLMAKTGVSLMHVPYRGSTPAGQALLAGEIHMNFMEAALARALVPTGMIRPLAITSRVRSPFFPDVPTLHEAGVEGFESATYWAMLAPAGVPQPILDRIGSVVLARARQPETQEAISGLGFIPMVGDAEAFLRHKAEDTALWGEIIRSRGIRLS